MAETKEKKSEQKQEKKQKEPKPEKPKYVQEDDHEELIRIMGYDIPGSKNIYTGLTKIKGVSWSVSNAICKALNLPRSKKILDLSPKDIENIEESLKNLSMPNFMKNRRADIETGETSHFYGIDLDFKKDFDIKRMKKTKSYKGIRHIAKLPVRGQRTKSHFRERGKAVGVNKKK